MNIRFKADSPHCYIVEDGNADYGDVSTLRRFGNKGWLWECDEGDYEPDLLRAIADKLDELNSTLAAQRADI